MHVNLFITSQGDLTLKATRNSSGFKTMTSATYLGNETKNRFNSFPPTK